MKKVRKTAKTQVHGSEVAVFCFKDTGADIGAILAVKWEWFWWQEKLLTHSAGTPKCPPAGTLCYPRRLLGGRAVLEGQHALGAPAGPSMHETRILWKEAEKALGWHRSSKRGNSLVNKRKKIQNMIPESTAAQTSHKTTVCRLKTHLFREHQN